MLRGPDMTINQSVTRQLHTWPDCICYTTFHVWNNEIISYGQGFISRDQLNIKAYKVTDVILN